MQTRHSTGAVRERRVWDFSRKRLKSEKSDTTPRLLIEQLGQDETEQKQVVIPYGQEEKLFSNLKKSTDGKIENSSLVSLYANYVKLFQGEFVELDDGSRAVKLPEVEQENEIILIAVTKSTKTIKTVNTEHRDCEGEAQETETLETISGGDDSSTELDDKCSENIDKASSVSSKRAKAEKSKKENKNAVKKTNDKCSENKDKASLISGVKAKSKKENKNAVMKTNDKCSENKDKASSVSCEGEAQETEILETPTVSDGDDSNTELDDKCSDNKDKTSLVSSVRAKAKKSKEENKNAVKKTIDKCSENKDKASLISGVKAKSKKENKNAVKKTNDKCSENKDKASLISGVKAKSKKENKNAVKKTNDKASLVRCEGEAQETEILETPTVSGGDDSSTKIDDKCSENKDKASSVSSVRAKAEKSKKENKIVLKRSSDKCWENKDKASSVNSVRAKAEKSKKMNKNAVKKLIDKCSENKDKASLISGVRSKAEKSKEENKNALKKPNKLRNNTQKKKKIPLIRPVIETESESGEELHSHGAKRKTKDPINETQRPNTSKCGKKIKTDKGLAQKDYQPESDSGGDKTEYNEHSYGAKNETNEQKDLKCEPLVKNHACSYCSKSFKLKRDLVIHVRSHTGERPYLCTVCNKAFSQKSILKGHMRTHTGEKPFVCDYCGKAFRDATILKVHVTNDCQPESDIGDQGGQRDDTDKQKDAEGLCDSSVKKEYNEHSYGIKSKFGIKYSCHYCDRDFERKMNLILHVMSHTGAQAYVCTVCKKTFQYKKQLKKHKMTHTVERPLKCQFCLKVFRLSSVFKMHIRLHTGETPYKCQFCDRAFVCSTTRNRHLITQHTGEKKYTCEVCGKDFKLFIEYRMHLKEHPGERLYSCKECGKRFSSKYNRNAHTATHNKEYVMCEICGKSLANISSLNNHKERYHLTEKPYDIEKCDQIFKDEKCLQNHVKEQIPAHERSFPYPYIEKCDQKFKDEKCLQNHVKEQIPAHERSFPYPCSTCVKRFVSKSHLQNHVKEQIPAHERSFPYPCSTCVKRFVSKSHLKRHLLTHIHRENTILLDITATMEYTCTFCEGRYKNKRSFMLHHNPHPEAKNITFKCVLCKRTFATLTHLGEHAKLHEHLKLKENESEKIVTIEKLSPGNLYIGRLCNGTLSKCQILKGRLNINKAILSGHEKSATVTGDEGHVEQEPKLEHVPDSGSVDNHVELLEQAEGADMSVELEHLGQIEKVMEGNSLEHGD